MSTLTYCLSAYFISASVIHMIYILNHDLVHYTASKNMKVNEVLSIVCGFSTCVPYGITFGRYHREHHKYQGYPGKDTDLCSTYEM